ncbi:MAG: hypothetical protein HRT60_10465, partial [Dinoroseobacter sp.]|nr:hypothetical protein [Dinoroseobacter sp.]
MTRRWFAFFGVFFWLWRFQTQLFTHNAGAHFLYFAGLEGIEPEWAIAEADQPVHGQANLTQGTSDLAVP